jgi:hypothetical protein
MPMDAPCCMNSQDIIIKRILTVLKNMDMQYRLKLVKELSKIHPAFIDLLDYQLQDPPKPE